VGPGAVILGLLILVFHLTRPWTFWKLMFHYSFTSVMSMGVMLFQLYMVVLVLWQAQNLLHDPQLRQPALLQGKQIMFK
ncbi:NrfD/PsrC family molybdoenzyme membrane anchor subunit, partial [Escherichia sp. HC-CC]